MPIRTRRTKSLLIKASRLHPDFPVVSGPYQVTREWSLFLPGEFNSQPGRDSLLFWRPGLALWIAVWNNTHARSARERMRRLKADISERAEDVEEEEDPGALRLRFRLRDDTHDAPLAYYAFALSEESAMHIAIYFDDEAQSTTADGVWRSISRGSAGRA